jgi:hypothetical protein
VHDFNPGIDAAGVFWTIEVDGHSVKVSPGSGTATMDVQNVALVDAFTVANALFGDPSTFVPATASYHVEWGGVIRRYQARNDSDRFAGTFVDTASATIEWSATNAQGFRFTSTPGSSQFVYGLIGHERNGVFFDS